MRKNIYYLTLLSICLVQILLNNYLYISQYILISLLPAIVASLPLRFNTITSLLMAFVVGLAIDFISLPTLGISSCALLPCMLVRVPVLKLVYGDNILQNDDNSPLNYQSYKENFISILIFCALYMAVYVWLDGAMTRSFAFNSLRWLCSTLCSSLLCFLCSMILFKDN